MPNNLLVGFGRCNITPAMDVYIEGGYEARSSNFKAGVAERMIEIGKEMLAELK